MKAGIGKIGAALVALCLSLSVILPVTAEETEQYMYSRIFYSNSSGEVTALPAGERLNASITVRRTKGISEKLTFALLLYQDNRLVGADVDCKEVGAEDVSFNAAVTLPTITDNCYVNAVLWDSPAGMNAVCSSGIFPGGGAELKDLTVDGIPLVEQSESAEGYTYKISARTSAVPQLKAIAADNGARVNVTPPTEFPGQAVVTVTSADGKSENQYIVNYETGALVSDLKMTDLLLGTQADKGDGTFSKGAELRHNLRTGICPYVDRTEAAMTIASLPEDCIGKDYIAPCIGWKNDNGNDYSKLYLNNDIKDWTTFTLHRSATLKIFTRGDFPQFSDYTRTNQYIALSNSGASTTQMYYKHIDVTDDAGVKVQLPSAGSGGGSWWLVVLDYDGYSE